MHSGPSQELIVGFQGCGILCNGAAGGGGGSNWVGADEGDLTGQGFGGATWAGSNCSPGSDPQGRRNGAGDCNGETGVIVFGYKNP